MSPARYLSLALLAIAALYVAWFARDTHALAGLLVFAAPPALLAVAAWFELFDGVQTIAMGAIRGLKDARTTFLVGLFCYWAIGAPMAWLLAFTFGWGPTGVWWGLALGLACSSVSLTLAFEWKMRRMLKRESKVSKMAEMAC